MTFLVKKAFGGFSVVDDEGVQVGDTFTGIGSKLAAQEAAAKLNGGGAIVEIAEEQTDVEDFVRDGVREGRGA